MKMLAIGLAVVAMSVPARAETYRCDFTVKRQCSSDGQCRTLPPVVWATFNAETNTYARCDRSGCDSYQAMVSRSGIFRILALPMNGVFAKIADDGSAVEVTSIGTDVLISYGTCKRSA
jgi:hypothetical protein